MQGRLSRAGALVVLAFASAAPAAAERRELRAAGAVARDCATELERAGAAGVAIRDWTAPADGALSARLDGGEAGDWDLALFHAGGEPVGASTSVTADELVTTTVSAGERLVVQACRLGGAARVPLELDFTALELPAPPDELVSLESVAISGPADVARLEQLGVDVTHDVSPDSATVVLYSDAERALVASAGFATTTLVGDLAAHDAAERRTEQRIAQRAERSNLPSGRDTYRVYAEYTSELKALAQQNPGFVRSVVLGTTVEGRTIEGVEIAADVNRTDDGRPVYLNFGAHHAREWPSAEFPMEFAIDLVNGFASGNPRITALLGQVRVVIVPVVNVDGFIASRETAVGENKRRNCRANVPLEAALPCEFRDSSGVDLNRNYGAYWGGSGSGAQVVLDNYRGPAPYSEPESEAVHRFSSRIHPTVFITNHTFTVDGKWLRQPGFDDVIAVSPDEAAMKSLGDAMAGATGWVSELGYETLGDITGATEDWNYFAQATYGYTPEARGAGFHDAYADMVVEEYLGDAAHPGLGVREAFLIAGERAANPADHSVIAGSTPPGTGLGLSKAFSTPTSQQGLVVNDVLDTRLTVPTGAYEWHTNPSARPLVPGETWTMSCATPAGAQGSAQVAVARGERVEVNWNDACVASGSGVAGRCAGRQATLVGSGGRDRLRGTGRRDVILAKGGKDKVSARGGNDVVCGGAGKDRIKGAGGKDKLRGGGGRDVLRGGGGRDKLRGGDGRDRCAGGGGRDRVSGCA